MGADKKAAGSTRKGRKRRWHGYDGLKDMEDLQAPMKRRQCCMCVEVRERSTALTRATNRARPCDELVECELVPQ